MLLLVEQVLNGLQFGLLLFLLAAGLTLVFGIMDLVNLAHGSFYMMGAYFAATFVAWTGSFVLGAVMALGATLLLGIVLEFTALRHLYGRDHLDHVLATFGLILFFNEAVRLLAERAGIVIQEERGERGEVDRQKKQRDDLYAVSQLAATFFEAQLREHPHRQYAVDELGRRGLVPGWACQEAAPNQAAIDDALQAFRIGYA